MRTYSESRKDCRRQACAAFNSHLSETRPVDGIKIVTIYTYCRTILALLIYLTPYPLLFAQEREKNQTNSPSFEIDLTYEEALSATNTTILNTLAVRDKAYFSPSALCRKGKTVMLSGWSRVHEYSEYRMNMLVEIFPNRNIKLEFSLGEKLEERPIFKDIINIIYNTVPCDVRENWSLDRTADFYAVSDINSQNSISELMNKIDDTELERGRNDEESKKQLDRIAEKLDLLAENGGEPKWHLSESKDALDDSKTVVISKSISSAVFSSSGYRIDPMLYIRCHRNTTNLIVNADTYIADDRIKVVYRLDDDNPVSTVWSGSTSNKAAGLWSGAESIPLLRKMATAKRFVVEFRPKGDSPILMEFQISELDRHLPAIAEACNWNVKPRSDAGRAPDDKAEPSIPTSRRGLSIAEMTAIRQRVLANWSPNHGAPSIEDMRVVIRFSLKPDGTLASAPRIIDGFDAEQSQAVFKDFGDSAIRALYKSQPLPVPADRLDIELDFEVQGIN